MPRPATPNGPTTAMELSRLLPDAHVEQTAHGEFVIYTGLTVDPDDPKEQRLVRCCEECESHGYLAIQRRMDETFVIVQKCNMCERYDNDFDAAEAYIANIEREDGAPPVRLRACVEVG